MTDKPDLWHAPVPGPFYWDYRCLLCGEDVADHPSALRRAIAAIRRKVRRP